MQDQSRSNPTNGDRRIKSSDVQGLKCFRDLKPLVSWLHSVGSERDTARNRQLHVDQYCTLLLIWLSGPSVDSLRGLHQASELDKVHRKFSVGRASLGSLSESVTLFEPDPLKAIAEEFSHGLPEAEVSKFHAIDELSPRSNSKGFLRTASCTIPALADHGGAWTSVLA